MPTLTRWFIRTSFLYLILGLLTGAFLAVQTTLGLVVSGLFPVYFHLLVLGWLTSLIFGVVFWMFPKYSIERPRRSEALGWFTFIFLNLGLILRALAEPLTTLESGSFWKMILGLSALLQWLSGMAFVINSWGRVKER